MESYQISSESFDSSLVDASNATNLTSPSDISETPTSVRHRTDSIHETQIHLMDSARQHLTQHQYRVDDNRTSRVESDTERRRLDERYAFPLDSEKTAVDTHYQGSPFIMTWLMKVVGSASEVAFNQIIDRLIEGIQKEGQQHPEENIESLIHKLQQIRTNTKNHRNSERMKILRETCVNLYTKDSFLYRMSNQALRDHDADKIETLGPFCFLVYDYIGRKSAHHQSFIRRLVQNVHSKKKNPMIVYRGDTITSKKLEDYCQAARNMNRCFKWLCFVSTSTDKTVAERFGTNVIYEIDLGRYQWNDQFVNITNISDFSDEKEILLRPGIRFCVDQVVTDENTSRARVFIHVLPSYISTL